MFSTDESSQFNSSYTVSFIINAMPFPFSIPILLSCLTVVRCPFCKTANYAVEYRGGKTKEEKCLEQIVRINLHILASFLFFGSDFSGNFAHMMGHECNRFDLKSCRKSNVS